jgi:Holliday junction resolvasome RuvABC endonuclease subunit
MSWRPVMGIDPSLRGCAVAIAAPNAPTHTQRWKTDACEGVHARVARYRSIADPIAELARQHKPQLVVIEGYAMGTDKSKGNRGVHDRVELGGILRDRIVDHCDQVLEVAASQLKLFAAGHGFADKRDIREQLEVQYGRTFPNDDEADAWVCMLLGLQLAGVGEPENQFQLEVVCKLKGLPVPKRTRNTNIKQKELFL